MSKELAWFALLAYQALIAVRSDSGRRALRRRTVALIDAALTDPGLKDIDTTLKEEIGHGTDHKTQTPKIGRASCRERV